MLAMTRLNSFCMVLPMFHAFGIIRTGCCLVQGTKLVIHKRFTVKSLFESIQRHKITHLSTVPPMLLAIYNSPLLSQYDISSLQKISCSAAPLPENVARQVMAKLNTRIYQGWGLTEALPIASSSLIPSVPVNSVGLPVCNVSLKVVDVKSGEELGPDEIGELCVKGPQVMKGYYKNPAATAQCIDDDGWLHTGDIGRYNKFGCIYIVDRLKELIKYKGFQVAPAELEDVLLHHPKVADVAVIGIQDDLAGEVPKAFIVKKDPSLTADEIRHFLKGRVSSYKYLRGGIVFRNEIPKTASGKILRRQLKQNYQKSKL